MSKRAKKLAYLVPEAAISKAEMGVSPKRASHSTQKRWPVAFSILGAVSVSLMLWVAIGWAVLSVVALFN